MAVIVCYRCENSWEFTPPMARAETCPKCRWDARCCFNCQFYDRNAYRECREPQAEYVADKEKSNFCSYFAAHAQARSDANEARAAKDKLEALFGNKSTSDKDSQQLSSIEEEFRKFTVKKS